MRIGKLLVIFSIIIVIALGMFLSIILIRDVINLFYPISTLGALYVQLIFLAIAFVYGKIKKLC